MEAWFPVVMLRSVAEKLIVVVRGRLAPYRGRLWLPAALVVLAAVAGGGVAVLLVILAGMLVLDAMIPVPGGVLPEADARFRRLVRERARETRAHRLRGRPPPRLDLLDDRTGPASSAARRHIGVRGIPIAAITGTTEEVKARAFDRRFRPDSSSAEHWKRLWIAQHHGAILPPISVYRVGDGYVVRDGHHRVSVALERGAATIDADVVELQGVSAAG